MLRMDEEPGAQGAGAMSRFLWCSLYWMANERGYGHIALSFPVGIADRTGLADNVPLVVVFLKDRDEDIRSILGPRYEDYQPKPFSTRMRARGNPLLDAMCQKDLRRSEKEGDDAAILSVYQRMAEKRNLNALYGLGTMYEYGKHVAKDNTEAAKWYRRAADAGHVTAQTALAKMYLEGRGVTKDEVEALRLLLKSAEQGSARAQFKLAEMYQLGQGTPKNELEALRWYRISADQEYAPAQEALRHLAPR